MFDRLLKDALLIFGLTALAYGLTISFEYGYITYFGLPSYYVEVGPTTLLIGAFFIATSLLIPYLLEFRPIKGYFITNVFDFQPIASGLLSYFLLFMLLILFVYEPSVLFTSFTLSFFLTVGFMTVFDRMKVRWSLVDEEPHPYIRMVKTSVFLGCLASMLLFSGLVGRAWARSTEYFSVLEESDSVVIRVYGDKMLYAPYDSTNGTVSNTYGVQLLNGEPLMMTYQEVGRLKPADN